MFPLWDYSEKFRGEPSNYHSRAIKSSISELIKNYLNKNPEIRNSINTTISDKKDEYEERRYNKKDTMREPAIEPQPAAEIISMEEEPVAKEPATNPSLWKRFVSKVLG